MAIWLDLGTFTSDWLWRHDVPMLPTSRQPHQPKRNVPVAASGYPHLGAMRSKYKRKSTFPTLLRAPIYRNTPTSHDMGLSKLVLPNGSLPSFDSQRSSPPPALPMSGVSACRGLAVELVTVHLQGLRTRALVALSPDWTKYKVITYFLGPLWPRKYGDPGGNQNTRSGGFAHTGK